MPHDQTVEEYAREQGIPVLLATPFELMRVASGHPMVCALEDGQRVLVKLPTREEYLALTERARNELSASGVEPPPMPSAAVIDRMIAPVPL